MWLILRLTYTTCDKVYVLSSLHRQILFLKLIILICWVHSFKHQEIFNYIQNIYFQSCRCQKQWRTWKMQFMKPWQRRMLCSVTTLVFLKTMSGVASRFYFWTWSLKLCMFDQGCLFKAFVISASLQAPTIDRASLGPVVFTSCDLFGLGCYWICILPSLLIPRWLHLIVSLSYLLLTTVCVGSERVVEVGQVPERSCSNM